MSIATHLQVIVHVKEWGRLSNTGRLAPLAIAGARIRLHGLLHRPVNAQGIASPPGSTLVLYPGLGALPLTAESVASMPRPLTLLVPDGNWNQAKSMVRRLPLLREAKPVRLDGPTLKLSGLRNNIYADRMSTFQAIAHALGVLEGEEVERELLRFFVRFLES